MPKPCDALKGRADAIKTAETHAVFKIPLSQNLPDDMDEAYFAMGCFWGVERLFWQIEGVQNTAAGYMGGYTPNPTYDEICTGKTGHTETVRVVFDPEIVSYDALLKVFWENHDPTQGMRQGNDQGSQYRSAILTSGGPQRFEADISLAGYNSRLQENGFDPVTTEVLNAGVFYFAESEHQQYLAKNPGGYCALKGTGVSCVTGGA